MNAFNLSSFDWHDLYLCALKASKRVDGPARTALCELAKEFQRERDNQKNIEAQTRDEQKRSLSNEAGRRLNPKAPAKP